MRAAWFPGQRCEGPTFTAGACQTTALFVDSNQAWCCLGKGAQPQTRAGPGRRRTCCAAGSRFHKSRASSLPCPGGGGEGMQLSHGCRVTGVTLATMQRASLHAADAAVHGCGDARHAPGAPAGLWHGLTGGCYRCAPANAVQWATPRLAHRGRQTARGGRCVCVWGGGVQGLAHLRAARAHASRASTHLCCSCAHARPAGCGTQTAAHSCWEKSLTDACGRAAAAPARTSSSAWSRMGATSWNCLLSMACCSRSK